MVLLLKIGSLQKKNKMTKYKFGVFYTCYTEFEAIDYSLELLYKFYPAIPVYLVSDGGLDYVELEEKYQNIKCIREEDTRGFCTHLSPNNFLTENNQRDIKISIREFLKRIKDAIQYCQYPEYMLIMEPDVLVRGELNINNDAHLLGSRINCGLSDQMRDIIKTIPTSIDINTWGATPAIFKTETFLKCYDWYCNNQEIVNKICKTEYRFAFYDVLLPVIFAIMGYNEVLNPDITECFRNPNWENDPRPLLHQYRAKYPKINYTGTHSKDKWL